MGAQGEVTEKHQRWTSRRVNHMARTVSKKKVVWSALIELVGGAGTWDVWQGGWWGAIHEGGKSLKKKKKGGKRDEVLNSNANSKNEPGAPCQTSNVTANN